MDRSALPRIRMDARPAGLRFKAPDSALKRWNRFELKAAPTSEIALTGITGLDYTCDSVRKALKDLGRGPVRLLLNSPGGDAFEGIALFNLLREHPGKVTVSVLGIAASAASVIAMAGDRIEMGESSFLMIHSASGMVMGNAADMNEFAAILAQLDESVAELYARRSGLSVKEVLAMMQRETYLSAKEAVRKGFADAAIADPDTSKKSTASASMRSPLPALATPALLAASGNQHAADIRMSISPPGASGNPKGNTAMSLHQALATLNEAKRTKQERQGELIKLRKDSPDSYGAEERAEFDSLDTELVSIEDDIRATKFEMRMAAEATPVVPNDSRAIHPSLRAGRGTPFLNLKHKDADEKFKGQNWTRKIIANALAYASVQQGIPVAPADIAQSRWGKTNPTLVNVIRMAAVPGAGTDSGEWGSELVQSDTRYTGDFLEFLYGMTVFDRLPLREVPAHVTIKGTDGAATGYWVGQSKAIPATSGSASSVALTPLKVAAVAVASNELLADSSPSAEMWIRDLLANALAQRIDTTFLSASAASAGVSPAGILNGISAGTSAGATADNIRTDLSVMAQNFIDAKNARNLWIVTSPGLGLALKLLKNSLGQPEFDGVTLEGGTIEGFRLLFGDNVGSGDVIMLKPDEIWKIGDSGLQVSFSRDATIEQDTAPSGATDTPVGMTTTNATNMFQEDSTAIRVIRRINFQKRRTHAVAYIGDAGYGGVAS
jgi:ATP-dependent protease ClpP protease subunit